MILVFDTSSFSQILNGDRLLIEKASNQEFTQFLLPLAADAELRYGFRNGNREERNLISYESIKRGYNAEVIAPDQDTAIMYAELATWCAKNGISLSNNDLWIAATTVQHGGRLLTTDKDFARLPQVSLAS